MAVFDEFDGFYFLVGFDDVAKVLGYSNSRKALQDHVDNEDRTDGVTIRDAIGRNQKMIVINESDLYALILLLLLLNNIYRLLDFWHEIRHYFLEGDGK